MNGAVSCQYFENFVVLGLLKNYTYSCSNVGMTYYRDSNLKEIDILVEINGLVHPMEIIKSAHPDRGEIKKFDVLNKATIETGCGGLICMCEQVVPIDAKNNFIPCNLI